MNLRLYFTILLFLSLTGLIVPSSWAQELPPPTTEEETTTETETPTTMVTAGEFSKDPELPFTGTLAEDDPENEELQKEQELFGPEPEEEEVLEEEEEEEEFTHVLKFFFTSHIQFVNQENPNYDELSSNEPYMEIEYMTQFEIPLNLKDKRQSTTIEAEYETQNWGSLARNEFFDCRLEIAIPQIPVDVTTRLKTETLKEEGEEEEIINHKLAIKIAFSKEAQENWFSYCTDVSGAILNTQGDTEEYNLETLSMVEPSLKTLLIDGFLPDEESRISLSVEPTLIDDEEIANDVVLFGDGTVIVEPY